MYFQSFYKIFHRRKDFLKNFYTKSLLNYNSKKSYSSKIKNFYNFKSILFESIKVNYETLFINRAYAVLNNYFTNILTNNCNLKINTKFFYGLRNLYLSTYFINSKIHFFKLLRVCISKKKFNYLKQIFILYKLIFLNTSSNLFGKNSLKNIVDSNLGIFNNPIKIRKEILDGNFFALVKPGLNFLSSDKYYSILKFFFPEIALEFYELALYNSQKFLYLLLKKTSSTKKIVFINYFFIKYKIFKRFYFFKRIKSLHLKKNNIKNLLSFKNNTYDFSVYFYYRLLTFLILKVYRKKNFYVRSSGSYGLRY
jgi:hypothetical protein